MATRNEIIIRTGMDNTQVFAAARGLMSYIKGVGAEIKRGFIPSNMQSDLVSYYRQAGVASGTAFMQGQKEAGGATGGGFLRGIGGFLALAGIQSLASRTMNQIRGAENAAEITGQSFEGIQKMDYAFRQFGIDVEKGNNSLERLNIKIGDARTGGKAAQEIFDKWGIAIEGKDNAQIISEISNKMKEMADPAQRAAMAFDLMGRTGKDLIPLLKQGADAMKAIGSHAPIISDQDKQNILIAKQEIDHIGNILTAATGQLISWFMQGVELAGKMSTGYRTWAAGDAEADYRRRHPSTVAFKSSKERSAYEAEGAKLDDKHAQNMEESARRKMTIQSRIDDDLKKQWDLHKEMDRLDEKSNERKEKQIALDTVNKQLEADIKDLREETAKTEKRISDEKERQEKAVRTNISSLTSGATTTLADIAGRDFTGQLARNYGAGGKWDLGSGTGPGGNIAREYLLTQKQAQWDFTYGKGGMFGEQYGKDISKLHSLGNSLMDMGLIPDTRDMKDIATATANSEKTLAAIKSEGILIKGVADGQ